MDLLKTYAGLGESPSDDSDSDDHGEQPEAGTRSAVLLQAGSAFEKKERIEISSSLLSGVENTAEVRTDLTSSKKRQYSTLPLSHQRKAYSTAKGSDSRYISKRERNASGSTSQGNPQAIHTAGESTHTLSTIVSRPPPQLAQYMATKGKRSSSIIPSDCLATWADHSKAVIRLRWHKPHGQLLLSCGMDGNVCIWEPFQRSGCVRRWQPHGSTAVRAASWFYDGFQVLSGGYNNKATLSDAETGKLSQFERRCA